MSKAHEVFIDVAQSYNYPIDVEPDFAFDRIGTHPLENFNGNIRDTAHANDTCSSTSHIIARAHVQKLLKNEMNIPNKRRTRVNAGGIKLSHSENVIDYPPEIDSPSRLVESLFVMADAATPETILKHEFSSEYVNIFIHYLAECQIISDKKGFNPKLSIPEESRNNNISGRNIMFSKK